MRLSTLRGLLWSAYACTHARCVLMEVGRVRNSVELTTLNCLVSTSHRIPSLGIWFVRVPDAGAQQIQVSLPYLQLPLYIVTSSPCGPARTACFHRSYRAIMRNNSAGGRHAAYLHTCLSNCFCSLLLALLLLRTSHELTAHIHMVANMTCQSGNSLLQHMLRLTNRCNFIIRSKLLSTKAESCLIQICRASTLHCARGGISSMPC